MLQEKFGDDFPLRKTGNCPLLNASSDLCILGAGSLCMPIECLLKHDVSLFEKQVESQSKQLAQTATRHLFVSIVIIFYKRIICKGKLRFPSTRDSIESSRSYVSTISSSAQ